MRAYINYCESNKHKRQSGKPEKERIMAQKNPKALVAKEATIDRVQLADAHPNHEHHLCHIISLRNMRTASKLAKDAQYICFLCGRAAKDRKNLCEPVKI